MVLTVLTNDIRLWHIFIWLFKNVYFHWRLFYQIVLSLEKKKEKKDQWSQFICQRKIKEKEKKIKDLTNSKNPFKSQELLESLRKYKHDLFDFEANGVFSMLVSVLCIIPNQWITKEFSYN